MNSILHDIALWLLVILGIFSFISLIGFSWLCYWFVVKKAHQAWDEIHRRFDGSEEGTVMNERYIYPTENGRPTAL